MRKSLDITKRAWAVILMLLICASCISCFNISSESAVDTNESGEKTDELRETEPLEDESDDIQDTTDEESSQTSEEVSYKDIQCVTHTDYEKKQIVVSDEGIAINVTLPCAWSFEQRSADGYDIFCDERKIGEVMRSDGVDIEWVALESEPRRTNTVEYVVHVEKKVTDEEVSFRYRITFASLLDPENILISLSVDFAEMSARTKNQMWSARLSKKIGSDPQIGALIGGRAQESILIIGNSFIGSSSIGSILKQMCQVGGKNTEVNSISRGYAHVSTYTNDEYFMEEVRGGAYGIIFVCGFYSNDESAYLSLLEDACNASKTRLVIFPAHNEPRECIDLAAKEHENLYVLDWKSEIDALIDGGVDKWDMCIDDMHLHSTPLAGFVGAHMIYRTVFGELPKRSNYTAISTSEVVQKLGDYCSTGVISYIDDNAVVFK